MIKHQKTSPAGIDYFINVCQVLQQREFPDLLGVSEATMHFYGRAELVDEKFVVYVSGDKYEEVGMDTKLNFISYFVLDEDIEVDASREMVNASFYCHGNLDLILSSFVIETSFLQLSKALSLQPFSKYKSAKAAKTGSL